ncbi:hypothetical protein NKI94_26065 [Mesorhizobium australicum]|uniref:hypothetical protein n=1 Tax=Mesorhizobium australicum TaxID=536018 RepID=UPI0033389F26
MKLENEVRHKSEDVDDDVLADVVTALQRRVTVSHEFDIPYIAGYSVDAKTIYIDRHLPRTIAREGVDIRLAPFLVTHEVVEKALLDELRLHYLHAHQIALRAERDAVRGARPHVERLPSSDEGSRETNRRRNAQTCAWRFGSDAV